MTLDQPVSQPASPPPRQTTAYLKELFTQVGFTIDARRGQNFLVDLNLLDLLARTAAPGPDDVVLEVGTGTGALTERLAATAGHVITCEIDARLAQLARDRLVDRDNVELVEGDVLARKHRLAPAVLDALATALAARPGGRFLLAANLPYCVATPVISNVLALPRPFDVAVVTVQRELGERMTAAAGTSNYNALSVWVGSQCRGEIVRILPPSVFWPRPKVDSAIVRLELEPERRGASAPMGRGHALAPGAVSPRGDGPGHRRSPLRRAGPGRGCPGRAAVSRPVRAAGARLCGLATGRLTPPPACPPSECRCFSAQTALRRRLLRNFRLSRARG